MLKNITLKYRMIFGGIAAVLIPFSVAGIIIYIQLSSSLLEIAKNESIHIATDISESIDTMLKQEIRLASAIAGAKDVIKAFKTGDYHIAQKELEGIYRRIARKDFTIFLMDKDGIDRMDVLFRQQVGLDLSDRDYFLKAKEGKPSVGGPFISKGKTLLPNPIIVVSVPIQEKNEFLGVVCLAFSADFLVNIISKSKDDQKGYAYLINTDGLVLAHPEKELALNLRLLDQPGTEEIKKIIQSGKTGVASYVFDGTKKIVGLSYVKQTNWVTAFTENWDDIMFPVNKILFSILISGICFLIITISTIVIFFSKISDPIQKSMELIKEISNHTTETILQIGVDRKIIFANSAFKKISGLKSKEIIGTEPDFTNLNNITENQIWEFLEAGTPWSGRIELKANTSEKITLDIMLIPLKNKNNVIQGYLEIGRDITSEIIIEKRLQQAQKLEAIGTLAGGIAHDFNNILSGIFGYAELLLMKNNSVSETEKYIRRIIIASERARDLISQILTFSRETDVEFKPLLPKSVLKEALKLLRASIPVTITIESEIKSDAAIMADPTQIHQIVMNLFTNAVHAIGENAGTIKLELEDFDVDKEFAKIHPDIKPGKHIILRISDTGNGMEQETMNHLFEPFFTTKAPGEGTGLGLSVVHGIVKKLNGIITVYSEIGKGTVFNVIVPRVQAGDSESYQPVLSIMEGTKRIIIVDDEATIAETMQSVLTSLGYKATAFTDSEKALAAIKENPDAFDVVITDHSMPQISGLEMAKKIKEANIDIPVILSSGYFNENIKLAAQKLGISDLMAKPVNTYQLTATIHRVLKEKKSL